MEYNSAWPPPRARASWFVTIFYPFSEERLSPLNSLTNRACTRIVTTLAKWERL
jgi:hypothetical protein